MSEVLQHKVVAALPSPLEADSIYYVRVGTGFDIHITNSTGVIVAYDLNVPVSEVLQVLGNSTTASLSQDAVTRELSALESAMRNQTVNMTGTSGSIAAVKINAQFNPATPSTAQQAALEVASFLEGKTSAVGGWVGGLSASVAFGAGAVADKGVGNAVYAGLGGNANVSKILGYEFVLNAVSATCQIENVVGFYVPNMAGVPNIKRVPNLVAFGNDHADAIVKSNGSYMKTMDRATSGLLREIGPPPHPGLRVGRVFGAYGRDLALASQDYTLPAGTLVLAPIYLPHRATISTVGINTGARVVGANLKFALFHTNNIGSLGYKIYESANRASEATSVTATAVNKELEAGMYFLCVIASAAIPIKVRSNTLLATMFGSSTSTAQDCVPLYSLGSFPAALPADVTDISPTGYLAPFCPDLFWTIS